MSGWVSSALSDVNLSSSMLWVSSATADVHSSALMSAIAAKMPELADVKSYLRCLLMVCPAFAPVGRCAECLRRQLFALMSAVQQPLHLVSSLDVHSARRWVWKERGMP